MMSYNFRPGNLLGATRRIRTGSYWMLRKVWLDVQEMAVIPEDAEAWQVRSVSGSRMVMLERGLSNERLRIKVMDLVTQYVEVTP